MAQKILVVTGPTASGKTALGIALAKKIGGEIVSADSMQIYRGMDIGTAKPTTEEMAGVPHHMIDLVPPSEAYSVARYVDEASACVDDIISRGLFPIVVGGTGLYIESLIAGRSFSAPADESLRLMLMERYAGEGGEAMLEALGKVDPVSAARLHPNDKKRIVRAMEIYETTGMTISEHDKRSRQAPPRYDALVIVLSFRRREDLYERINRRVDAMMAKGLFQEVRRLLDSGVTPRQTAMQAIGYKELAEVLLGNVSLDEAVERIKMESRRYAKRQLSWFRRHQDYRWILWDKEPDFDNGLQISTEYLEYFGYNNAV